MRITFIADFLVINPFQFTRCFLDGAFDRVLGHIRRIGLFHSQAQTRVRVRVAGEDFSTLGVNGFLAMLDVGPFTVSRHESLSLFMHN